MEEELKEEKVEEVVEAVTQDVWVRETAILLLKAVAPMAIVYETKQETLLQELANRINETLK